MSRTLPSRVARAGLSGGDVPDAVPGGPGLASHDRRTVEFVERGRPLAATLNRGPAFS